MHAERIATGNVFESVAAEADELVRLFQTDPANKGLPVPTSKTVENNIRERHRRAASTPK